VQDNLGREVVTSGKLLVNQNRTVEPESYLEAVARSLRSVPTPESRPSPLPSDRILTSTPAPDRYSPRKEIWNKTKQ
jgi:hypothetical protein